MSTSDLGGQLQESLPAAAEPLRAERAETALPAGRAAFAAPIVAATALLCAGVATAIAGVPLRDPNAVTVRRLTVAVAMTVGFLLLDIVVRAARANRGVPSPRAIAEVRRTRWTAGRLTVVAVAVACFHVTYLAYRNIKSVAPLLRPGDVFDSQLLDIDRWLLGGHDPYVALHDLLGTGGAAHTLSSVYMVFFAVIPLTLAAGLVLLPDLRSGLFVATALSLAWLLGAGSYLILPSIGPFHFDAAAFTSLPHTPVTDLQVSLDAATCRLPRRSIGARRGAEHRRLRLPAHGHLGHDRARRPRPRRAPRGPGDRLGPGHPHRRRDRVLRLALHPRRRRRA